MKKWILKHTRYGGSPRAGAAGKKCSSACFFFFGLGYALSNVTFLWHKDINARDVEVTIDLAFDARVLLSFTPHRYLVFLHVFGGGVHSEVW